MRTYLEELSSWSDIQELFGIEDEEPLMVYAKMEHNQDEENISYIEIVISHDGVSFLRLYQEWYPDDYPEEYNYYLYSQGKLLKKCEWEKGFRKWFLSLSANDKIEDWM